MRAIIEVHNSIFFSKHLFSSGFIFHVVMKLTFCFCGCDQRMLQCSTQKLLWSSRTYENALWRPGISLISRNKCLFVIDLFVI